MICKDQNKSEAGVNYEKCSESVIPGYEVNERKDDAIKPAFGSLNLRKGTPGSNPRDYDYTISNDGKLNMLKNPCDLVDENNDACSKLCNPDFMIKEDGSFTYDYKCGKRTALDSFKRGTQFAAKVINTAVNGLKGATDILGNIFWNY